MDNNKTIDELISILAQFRKRITSTINDKLASGVTFSQLMLIKQISNEAKTVSELSNNLSISPPAVSKMLDQLFTLDIISRIRSSNDRRIVVIQLTDKGKEIVREAEQIRNEVFKEILSPLTEEEVQDFMNILNKISNQL